MDWTTILKALLTAAGVTLVSLLALALYVVITAARSSGESGAFVVGGLGGLFLKLVLVELPAVFLLALLFLLRR